MNNYTYVFTFFYVFWKPQKHDFTFVRVVAHVFSNAGSLLTTHLQTFASMYRESIYQPLNFLSIPVQKLYGYTRLRHKASFISFHYIAL